MVLPLRVVPLCVGRATIYDRNALYMRCGIHPGKQIMKLPVLTMSMKNLEKINVFKVGLSCKALARQTCCKSHSEAHFEAVKLTASLTH